MRNEYCHVPVLSGLEKDHKQRKENEPQPFRPVGGADESNNQQLSDMCSTIVTGISNCIDKKLKTLCRSTEEMICELEGVNNRNDVEDLVVLSTDIEAMYPSLDTDQIAADVAREFLD